MNHVSDALLRFDLTAAGETIVSALLTTVDGNGEEVKLWVNDGSVADGRMEVSDDEYSIEFAYVESGLEAYRTKVAANDPLAHRTIVGRGTINGEAFVGFPDKAGLRIGLQRDTTGTPIAPPGLLA